MDKVNNMQDQTGKQDQTIDCPHKIYFKYKNTYAQVCCMPVITVPWETEVGKL